MMNPQEVAIYKLLSTMNHLIEDFGYNDDDEYKDYKYFRNVFDEIQCSMDILMRDVGRRHLTEADFMVDKCNQ